MSGLFLRGALYDDKAALDYVFELGEEIDPFVASVEGTRGKNMQSVLEPFGCVEKSYRRQAHSPTRFLITQKLQKCD